MGNKRYSSGIIPLKVIGLRALIASTVRCVAIEIEDGSGVQHAHSTYVAKSLKSTDESNSITYVTLDEGARTVVEKVLDFYLIEARKGCHGRVVDDAVDSAYEYFEDNEDFLTVCWDASTTPEEAFLTGRTFVEAAFEAIEAHPWLVTL